MSSVPSQKLTFDASIWIMCPWNQPPNPCTTTGLWASGSSMGSDGTYTAKCKVEYPAGTFYQSNSVTVDRTGIWRLQFPDSVELPTTQGSDWAELTAHLFDGGGIEVAASDAIEIRLASGGTNDC
jgi:hypothetical protein